MLRRREHFSRLQPRPAAAVDRRTQGRTSQVYRALGKEPLARFFRSEQQWAGRVVDRERPMSGGRLRRPQSAGRLAKPSARRPRLSRMSSCWPRRRMAFPGHAAPHAARGPTWPAGSPASTGNRRRAGSWAPKQPPECGAVQSSRVEHRASESRPGARSAHTPARPPRLPCSHRRRGTRWPRVRRCATCCNLKADSSGRPPDAARR